MNAVSYLLKQYLYPNLYSEFYQKFGNLKKKLKKYKTRKKS